MLLVPVVPIEVENVVGQTVETIAVSPTQAPVVGTACWAMSPTTLVIQSSFLNLDGHNLQLNLTYLVIGQDSTGANYSEALPAGFYIAQGIGSYITVLTIYQIDVFLLNPTCVLRYNSVSYTVSSPIYDNYIAYVSVLTLMQNSFSPYV